MQWSEVLDNPALSKLPWDALNVSLDYIPRFIDPP